MLARVKQETDKMLLRQADLVSLSNKIKKQIAQRDGRIINNIEQTIGNEQKDPGSQHASDLQKQLLNLRQQERKARKLTIELEKIDAEKRQIEKQIELMRLMMSFWELAEKNDPKARVVFNKLAIHNPDGVFDQWTAEASEAKWAQIKAYLYPSVIKQVSQRRQDMIARQQAEQKKQAIINYQRTDSPVDKLLWPHFLARPTAAIQLNPPSPVVLSEREQDNEQKTCCFCAIL